MLSSVLSLFASGQFIPHGHCYLWKPELVWLHILSDSIIGVSYYSIPIALVYFVRQRQDLPFNWIFFLFSAFIFACGTTHLMEIWTLWHPVYWLSGALKALTALVSFYTAMTLIPLVPKALALPSPAELEKINLELQLQITERQRAESALQKVNQEIREQAALIDIASDAIFVRDLENSIHFWSLGAARLYGWTVEESVGKITTELFHRESLFQLEAALKNTVEQGFWQGELEQITKTGRVIIVASRWTLLHHQFGIPQSILVVNTDITEKKQLEKQFYRAQRLESLGTLASGIAHDLNNVLNPIVMIAQLLLIKCQNVDARTQELFQALKTSSQRGAELVKQILTFARETDGKHILLQPEHLLQELVNVIHQTFPKSIDIQTNIPVNTLSIIKADPTQINQVLMNLVVNARDAMPNGGILTITAENRQIDQVYARMNLEAKAGDYIAITVSDTGTGIAPEHLEHIFDPFFTTKEVGQGTGLGLSTVLGIVKNHGGFVEVSSHLGKGTQFQVFLTTAQGILGEVKIEAVLPKGDGELILIADDEDIVTQITQKTLENYHYKTLVAEDGNEAIALYVENQQQISVVLLDMSMPNMDGFAAIRTLRNINPNLKIIATSGLPVNEQKAFAAGANKFLSKPYTATDLLTTLSEVIPLTFVDDTKLPHKSIN